MKPEPFRLTGHIRYIEIVKLTSQFWIPVVCITGMAGCSSPSQPNSTSPAFDPVLQVAPSLTVQHFENGQTFDVGIALFRDQWLDGTQPYDYFPEARMAFASNGSVAQVGATIVNGVSLPWIPEGSQGFSPDDYIKEDSNLYGSSDSMTFSYKNFEGESFSSTVSVAPSFGKIIDPDTIPVSKGCSFQYEHSVPGDSIMVSAYSAGYFTIPDTGVIVFKPNQLSYDSYDSTYGLEVVWYRVHWTTRVSPAGKRIGIYSEQEFPGIVIPVQP